LETELSELSPSLRDAPGVIGRYQFVFAGEPCLQQSDETEVDSTPAKLECQYRLIEVRVEYADRGAEARPRFSAPLAQTFTLSLSSQSGPVMTSTTKMNNSAVANVNAQAQARIETRAQNAFADYLIEEMAMPVGHVVSMGAQMEKATAFHEFTSLNGALKFLVALSKEIRADAPEIRAKADTGQFEKDLFTPTQASLEGLNSAVCALNTQCLSMKNAEVARNAHETLLAVDTEFVLNASQRGRLSHIVDTLAHSVCNMKISNGDYDTKAVTNETGYKMFLRRCYDK
jgi:hypothetical protein